MNANKTNTISKFLSLPRFSGRLFYWVCLFVIGLSPLISEEEQSHGVLFEREVINHLLERDYTAEWDIPAVANRYNPGTPISVKMIKWGNSIYLGDALRQRQINHPFEMIVSFYQKDTYKNIATLQALHLISISPEKWSKAWGNITEEELVYLNKKIDQGSIEEARTFAKAEATKLRSKMGILNIHPKINKDQRRVQCAISFKDFYKFFFDEEEPKPQEKIILWGKEFRDVFKLGSRSR